MVILRKAKATAFAWVIALGWLCTMRECRSGEAGPSSRFEKRFTKVTRLGGAGEEQKRILRAAVKCALCRMTRLGGAGEEQKRVLHSAVKSAPCRMTRLGVVVKSKSRSFTPR